MFSTDLYAPETIDNMLSVFRRVLETCLEQPQAAVASMPLLRDADYAKLDAMGLVRVEDGISTRLECRGPFPRASRRLPVAGCRQGLCGGDDLRPARRGI
ncbi:hypothetical protein P3342_007336 [Pyrenophora teres f. teres]|nr:hypothetical protein P3342_007336 [Pyrenophora teres f. teres]